MSEITFENTIKPMFEKYVTCMKNVVVADEEGTANLDLADYETVVRFHRIIQVAIHGYEAGSNAPHPMPPGGSLPTNCICEFDKWVKEGMGKGVPV